MVTPNQRLAPFGLALLILLQIPPANAITINVRYVSGNSTVPAGNLDPSGSRMVSIVQAAADRWEDIIEDSYTMTINVWYETTLGTALADAPIVRTNGNGGLGNRTLEGNIRFNNSSNWYYDPSPESDSEFNLGQTLFRDLLPANQTNFFDVTIAQPLLEAGYGGQAFATAPAAAQNNIDLLTLALHEIGHHLGVTNQFALARAEWADGDYDLPPSLLAGAVMAANTDTLGMTAHLEDGLNAVTLMQPGTPAGTRRLPSATDVFAAASVSEWGRIDLQRQDYLGGSPFGERWTVPGNWEGNQNPGSADDVYVRHGGTTTIPSIIFLPTQVANLFVQDGSELIITDGGEFPGGKLLVRNGRGARPQGKVTIGQDANQPFARPARLRVIGGEPIAIPDLETTVVEITDGGQLVMAGGRTLVNQLIVSPPDPAITGNGGEIIGDGIVEVTGGMRNDGRIVATTGPEGDTLFFNHNSGTTDLVWDLSGGGIGPPFPGRVIASDGNIEFNGGAVGRLHGEILVENGHHIAFHTPRPLRVDVLGNVNVKDTGSELVIDDDLSINGRVEIDGSAMTVGSSVYVAGDANGPTYDFGNSGALDVCNGGSVSVQSGNPVVVYEGGTVRGAGAFNVAVLRNGGEVHPGCSTGTFTINGDYNQLEGSGLVIEIGGTEVGQYDVLEVNGHVSLDGTLDILFIDDFVPRMGDSFDILDFFDEATGSFSEINVRAGINIDFSSLLDNGEITVIPEPSALLLCCLGVFFSLSIAPCRVTRPPCSCFTVSRVRQWPSGKRV